MDVNPEPSPDSADVHRAGQGEGVLEPLGGVGLVAALLACGALVYWLAIMG